jgi:general secretion pathway protein D
MSNISLTLGVPSSVKLNDQFSVQVNASGVQNLYNAVFVVNYDPKTLEVVTQAEGALLKQNGSPVNFQAFADKKKGELWVSESRLNGTEGASGSGVLAMVTFKAIGKGPAGIGLGNTNFSTKGGDLIPVTPFKSVVEVK